MEFNIKNWIRIECPLCGSNELHLYKEYRTSSEYSEVFGHEGMIQKVEKCNVCSCIFNNPRPSGTYPEKLSQTDPSVFRGGG